MRSSLQTSGTAGIIDVLGYQLISASITNKTCAYGVLQNARADGSARHLVK